MIPKVKVYFTSKITPESLITIYDKQVKWVDIIT